MTFYANYQLYLNFQGNTEKAFIFYQSIFGGEFIGGINRFSDTHEGDNLPENERDKVMHIALPIGDRNVIMGTDALESMNQTVEQGNNFYISIQADSKEQADQYSNGLSDEAEIEMEMQNMFWGDYFGMLTDKFGIKWMVSFSENS
ncbi:MAG: VOC family protein [Balneolaceae bacterium]|nr:VOC family protein [Balneolaceae bacterium]MDR9408309.1 VOC family protein [Balneolaceae bacterium]